MATVQRSRRRPLGVTLLVAVMAFQAISGLGGGIGLLLNPNSGAVVPLSVLDGSPFDTFLIPGLLLFVVLGIAPAIATWALLAKPRWPALAALERAFGAHWAWTAAGAVGVALLVFLGVEALMIGYHFLQVVYGVVGVAIVALALLPATRRWYRA